MYFLFINCNLFWFCDFFKAYISQLCNCFPKQFENIDTEILKNSMLLFNIVSWLHKFFLAFDWHFNIFTVVTNESDKTSTKSSNNEDVSEIKLEPNDLYDPMIDVAEQIGSRSCSSASSQIADKASKNVAGI